MAKHPSTVPAKPSQDALTNDVLDGLKKEPKELSAVWFYDELGSFLFDNICELPEYYITRTELQIMHGHAAEMAQHIGHRHALQKQIHQAQVGEKDQPDRDRQADQVDAFDHRVRIARLGDRDADRRRFDLFRQCKNG